MAWTARSSIWATSGHGGTPETPPVPQDPLKTARIDRARARLRRAEAVLFEIQERRDTWHTRYTTVGMTTGCREPQRLIRADFTRERRRLLEREGRALDKELAQARAEYREARRCVELAC